jgi:protocatechuate 3,4-dioxygenase beta subunit
VVVSLLAGASATAQQTWVAPDTGTASIRGLVTAADGSGPVRRAEVGTTGRLRRIILTDGEGRYLFRDLPAGRYAVTAGRSGYQTTGHGEREPGGAPRHFEVAHGEARDSIDIVLPKGGVIEVVITDEYGEPLEGVAVRPVRHRWIDGRLNESPPHPASDLRQRNFATDDRGHVRLVDLLPGPYILAADMRLRRPAPTARRESVDGVTRQYLPAFYPAAPSVKGMQPLELSLGQEVSIRMAIATVPVVRLSGRALRADGSALTTGIARLTSANSVSVGDAGSSGITANGFEFSEVRPGDYVVGVAPDASTTASRGTLPVTVTEAGLADLLVTMATAATTTPLTSSLRGRIVVDQGSSADAFQPEYFSLKRMLSDGRYVEAEIGPDRTVAFTGLAGDGRAWIWHNRDYGWFLKSVLLNGRDVTEGTFALPRGEATSGLQVLVTQSAASVTGVARDADGAAVSGYQALIFADDPARWTPDSRFVAAAFSDDRGRFQIGGLPSGRYRVVALESAEPVHTSDPVFLGRLRDGAISVTLREGEAQSLTLPLAAF